MSTILVLLLAVGAAAGAVRAEPAGQPAPAAPLGQDFVPVDQLPPEEALPAAPLLIAAYGFAWLAIAGYLWSIRRRLDRVERELQEARRRIPEEARRI